MEVSAEATVAGLVNIAGSVTVEGNFLGNSISGITANGCVVLSVGCPDRVCDRHKVMPHAP